MTPRSPLFTSDLDGLDQVEQPPSGSTVREETSIQQLIFDVVLIENTDCIRSHVKAAHVTGLDNDNVECVGVYQSIQGPLHSLRKQAARLMRRRRQYGCKLRQSPALLARVPRWYCVDRDTKLR